MAEPASLAPRAATEPWSLKGGRLVAAIGLAAALVVIALVFLFPKKGGLLVNAAGPNNSPVDNARALLDGKLACEPVPCRVAGVPAGPHLVRVVASGYQRSADEAVTIEGGRDSLVNIKMTRANTGTGIEIKLEATDLHVLIDGKDRGTVPAKISDLAPGEYTVRLEGSPLYAPLEQKVTVEADKLTPFEPKLKVLKGLITVRAGVDAEGAIAYMVSGGKRRQIPKLPARIEVPPTDAYQVVGTKPGYKDFETQIDFTDGKAEKTVDIDLVVASAQPSQAPAPAPGPVAAAVEAGSRGRFAPRAAAPAAPAPAPAAKEPAKPSAAAAGDQGKLAINSIPISSILLDGRPIGNTPKQISVAPGPHAVLFIHPELGRKSVSVSVQAGKTAVAAVKFSQ